MATDCFWLGWLAVTRKHRRGRRMVDREPPWQIGLFDLLASFTASGIGIYTTLNPPWGLEEGKKTAAFFCVNTNGLRDGRGPDGSDCPSWPAARKNPHRRGAVAAN
jgi:hypothetical protein